MIVIDTNGRSSSIQISRDLRIQEISTDDSHRHQRPLVLWAVNSLELLVCRKDLSGLSGEPASSAPLSLAPPPSVDDPLTENDRTETKR